MTSGVLSACMDSAGVQTWGWVMTTTMSMTMSMSIYVMMVQAMGGWDRRRRRRRPLMRWAHCKAVRHGTGDRAPHLWPNTIIQNQVHRMVVPPITEGVSWRDRSPS